MGNRGWAVVIVIVIAAFALIFLKGKGTNKNQAVSSSKIEGVQASSESAQASSSAMKKTYNSPPPVLPIAQIQGKKALVKTTKGDVIFEFFTDAPMAASNFIFLANDHFYDGLIFHRRVEGFVIQGGDPSGNGSGGPGYKFNDEPVTRDYKRGVVAMANAGPNTNGSQFFIMLADTPLPKEYTIFGQVVSGLDVVDKIQVGDVMQSVAIQ